MNSRRRVNAALIGLLVLVLATWLIQGEIARHHSAPQPTPPAVVDTGR